MAITTPWGFDNISTEGVFSEYEEHARTVNYRHGVSEGFNATVGTGRAVSVTAGAAVTAGVLVKNDATESVALAPNNGTTNRTDQVVVAVDWSTNSASLTVVQGTSPTAPALTQVAGSLWQMPLARVTVRPGVSTFLASDVVPCKPLPRQTYPYQGSGFTVESFSRNASNRPVGSATVADPGWPYYLEVHAKVYAAADNGYMMLRVDALRPGATAIELAMDMSSSFTLGTYIAPVEAQGFSQVITGPATVRALVSGVNISSGQISMHRPNYSHLLIKQIPA